MVATVLDMEGAMVGALVVPMEATTRERLKQAEGMEGMEAIMEAMEVLAMVDMEVVMVDTAVGMDTMAKEKLSLAEGMGVMEDTALVTVVVDMEDTAGGDMDTMARGQRILAGDTEAMEGMEDIALDTAMED